ncbi:MAG: hypothetical protein MK212_04650 [Saprospiraceae bacterium]|nr:hypothetical protein [Saprospiraceae bacterium]
MKFYYALYLLLFSTFNLQAQKEIKYVSPPTVMGDNYKVEILDIVADKDECKLKLKVKNTGEDYLRFNFSKVGFEYAGFGTYYPSKGKDIIIEPGKMVSKVIRIEGAKSRMVNSFTLKLEGLRSASVPQYASAMNNLMFSVGSASEVASNEFKVTISEVKEKKGTVTTSAEVNYLGGADNIGLVDLTKVTVLDANGVSVEQKISPQKLKVLETGETAKISLSITNPSKSYQLQWGDTYHHLTLVDVVVDPVIVWAEGTSRSSNVVTNKTTVMNNTTPAANNTTPAANNTTPVASNTTQGDLQYCPIYTGAGDGGHIKVRFFNTEGKCFKLVANGVLLVPDYSSSAVVNLTGGKKHLEFHFPDGTVYKDKITPDGINWEAASYRLKQKKNGDYNLVLNIGSVQATPESQARLDQQMAKMEADRKAREAESDAAWEKQKAESAARLEKMRSESAFDDNSSPTNSSSNSISSGSTNSSSSNTGSFSSSSGSQKVRLRVMTAGSPVAGCEVTIKIKGVTIGRGKTNSSGYADIYTNDLISRSIDVYGEKEGNNWHLEGLITLDENLYAEIDPAQALKLINNKIEQLENLGF